MVCCYICVLILAYNSVLAPLVDPISYTVCPHIFLGVLGIIYNILYIPYYLCIHVITCKLPYKVMSM